MEPSAAEKPHASGMHARLGQRPRHNAACEATSHPLASWCKLQACPSTWLRSTQHCVAAPRHTVTVDEEIALLTSASKPCLPVSRHTAPQWEGSCHEHPRGFVVCMFTPSHEEDPRAHPYLTSVRRFIVSWALPTPTTSCPPSPRQHILWLSQRHWLLGESHHRAVSG
jgi:hypothetical protein